MGHCMCVHVCVSSLPLDGRLCLVCMVRVPTTAPILSPWKQTCLSGCHSVTCASLTYSVALSVFPHPFFLVLDVSPPHFAPHFFAPPPFSFLSLPPSLYFLFSAGVMQCESGSESHFIIHTQSLYKHAKLATHTNIGIHIRSL